MQQLTFWDEPLCPEKNIWMELYDLKEKQNNTRRGLFSRHDYMKKEIAQLRQELELIKAHLLIDNEKIEQLYTQAIN